MVMDVIGANVWGVAPLLMRVYYMLSAFLQKEEPDTLDMSTLKSSLNEMFVHDIDPSYGYDPTVADHLHNGTIPVPGLVPGLVPGPVPGPALSDGEAPTIRLSVFARPAS